MAVLTKFSEAMSSNPSACRRVSFRMAAAMSGSVSVSERCMDERVSWAIGDGLYYQGARHKAQGSMHKSHSARPNVTISARGEDRVRQGHPWIYRADVVDVQAGPGEIVEVLGPRHRTIGHAFFSDRSQIPIRMLTRGEAPADASLVRARLENAIRYRAALALDATAYRVVHGEADLLPSLVVDRYADYLVVQALSQGSDRMLPDITRMLVELLQPAGILARNDPKVRTLEGLDQRVEVLHGTVPESVIVREGPVEYDVDLR